MSLVILVLISGCNSEIPNPKIHDWSWEYEILSEQFSKRLVEDLDWECIEYANRTTINPEWFDNCCIDINLNLMGGENKEYKIIMNNGTEMTMKITNNEDETYVPSHKFCIEGSEYWERMLIGNQTVDMAKCLITPKIIDTNETICIAKRLRGY